MANSDILLSLIRLSLGTSAGGTDLSALTEADWQPLVNLSFEHGVAAIAVDGLQSLYDRQPELELLLDSPELEALKYEWFGSAFRTEENYAKTAAAAEALAEKFPIKILKGLSVARKYPIPAHRDSVDLDVFVNENEDEIGSLLLKGVKVIREDYKHTGFKFQGVMVEYHKSLIGWKSLKNGKHIERTLRESLGTTDGIYPNDYFTALFLTVHSYTHFMLEDGISLKHIIDWYLCFNENENLRERVLAAVETFGMREFAESMARVADYVCKDPSTTLTKADSRMLDDILSSSKKKRFKNGHLNMAYNILFRNGWKFRAFAKEPNLCCLLRCGWGAKTKTKI